MDPERSTKVGSILAAAFASACCLGPAAFGALMTVFGTSVVLSGAATTVRRLAPLRPVFISVSLLALGAAFYTTYRKGACPTTGRKMMLWVLTGAVLILISSPYWLAVFE